jgi:energy-coupling factor transporter ATP-binding protein EcfA2
MPILRLVAEGVGPFEKLDLDLSDGKGNPHLGPHILAGVNGSGKSTVLKTIAWVLDREGWGFDHNEWNHSLAGHRTPRAAVEVRLPDDRVGGEAVAALPYPQGPDAWIPFSQWLRTVGLTFPAVTAEAHPARRSIVPNKSPGDASWRFRDWGADPAFDVDHSWACPVAAYAPSPKLRYLANLDITKSPSSPFENALAFGETVRNDLIQAWLANLRTRPVIAQDMKQPAEKYVQALERFESALRLIYEGRVQLVSELEPSLHPKLQIGTQRLNCSQLPDGIRATIGWLADFMMRQDRMQWDPRPEGKRPGLLLLDEIDAHLHPQWQRTLLPAIRQALPHVQIIVTSHSPFVINSCPDARVHVFDVDQNGHAFLKPSCDAPVGQSVMAILKDIFGVESRFDVRTEKELDEWYHLSRRDAVGPLPASDRRRMDELTRVLSERSESLKGIVFKPSGLSGSIESGLRALGGSAAPPPRSKAKPRQKKAS